MEIRMPKIISIEKTERQYRKRSVPGVQLFMNESVILTMAAHADIGFADNKEIMGLILGTVYNDEEGEYSVADGTATTKLDSTNVSVKFNSDSLEELFTSIDKNESGTVVGWYHSHPGFGCYLSDVDVKTHSDIFGEHIGFSIVLDPSDETLMAFTVEDGVSKEVQMVVSEDS